MLLSGSGLQLFHASEGLLERGLRTFASAGQWERRGEDPREVERRFRDLANATTDVVIGRFLFRTGVALIGRERQISSSLVDILA